MYILCLTSSNLTFLGHVVGSISPPHSKEGRAGRVDGATNLFEQINCHGLRASSRLFRFDMQIQAQQIQRSQSQSWTSLASPYASILHGVRLTLTNTHDATSRDPLFARSLATRRLHLHHRKLRQQQASHRICHHPRPNGHDPSPP